MASALCLRLFKNKTKKTPCTLLTARNAVAYITLIIVIIITNISVLSIHMLLEIESHDPPRAAGGRKTRTSLHIKPYYIALSLYIAIESLHR